MTLNPLVEKILESTIQKGLDMSVLNELEFTPDDGCEAVHSEKNIESCSGTATHWYDCTCTGKVKKICQNAAQWVAENGERLCKNCKVEIWQCWYVEPIVK